MAASRPPCRLRIAAFLIRGPDAPYILADLEEGLERDMARGLTASAARRRYAMNVAGSAFSSWRGARRRLPGGVWLDVKLGSRILLQQPLLTLVALLTLAVGIPIGLLPVHITESLTASLPVEAGDDIVRIWNWDRVESREIRRPIHDLVRWREELKSFEGLGMGRSEQYNLISDDGRAAPVRGAEVTASVFTLLRVPAALGRALNHADEVPGAPNVVVLGHDIWQSRMAGDPEIVGSSIRIGGESWTVVGVMPDGFLFPHRDHLWLPFRYDPLQYEEGKGPVGWVMGRLAEGVTLERARSELVQFRDRMEVEAPRTHGHLEPRVAPYTEAPVSGLDKPEGLELLVVQGISLLLLGLACCNVGVLILARAASRTQEFAIRVGLGASRGRIVSQVFTECLVLAAGSTGIGLLVGQMVATRFNTILMPVLPYWAAFDITGKTVVRGMALAVVSAAIAGVGPALKATGQNAHAVIKRGARGTTGIRFGRASSLLIVGQVAVAVFTLGFGSALVPTVINRSGGLGIEAGQYLAASVQIPWLDAVSSDSVARGLEFQRRVRTLHVELVRRLDTEPDVGPVAVGTALPGMAHSRRRVEVEGEVAVPDSRGHPAWVAGVDIGFFRALNQDIRIGRDFTADDGAAGGPVAIVNATFVAKVLGGGPPLGRRIRTVPTGEASPGPWHEIVGVVGSLGMNELNPDLDQGVYYPMSAGDLHPVRFAIRTGADPASFVSRLRSLVAEIDADAIVQSAGPLDEVMNAGERLARWGLVFVTFVALVTVLLSGAGIYALMSFTVAERTGEIGVRAALGARPARLVATIAKRAFGQLLAGVVVGATLSSLMLRGVEPDADVLQVTNWQVSVPVIALAVMVVGLLACVSPTRKGLRIRPAEALKG